MVADRGGRRRVTREDVARLAGVSVPVVTYALNGGPKNVSPATRAKVMAAVSQLGYHPNAAARALRRGRSELLGIIVPSLDNPLFAALAHEVEAATSAQGITLIVLSSAPGQIRGALDRLAARQVDGVLIATPVRSNDIAAIELSGLPTVLLNQPSAIEGIDVIGVDLYGGARQAVEHLVQQGHQSIAFMGPATGDQRRREGWYDVLTAAGLQAEHAFDAPFTREGGYAAGRQLLQASPRPTALFASSDQIALGALRAFHEAGVSVPEELAIASFDDSPDAEYAWPALTSVRQPVAEMAADAVALLLDDDGRSAAAAEGHRHDSEPGAGRSPRKSFHQYSVELVIRASSE